MFLNRRQVSVGLASAMFGSMAVPGTGRAQAKPIRIGVITSLTGFAQIYGDANRIGAEIAAERINAAGGVGGRKIEIVLRDDKASSDSTVAAYRDLASQGVHFFLAGPISATAVALAPLFKDTDNILIAAGPNNLSITHELFNKNVFRAQLTSVPVFAGLGKVVADKAPDIRDWIAISSDQQANIDLSNIFLASLKKAHAAKGVDVTVREMVLTKAGAGDFRAQIASLMNSGATGVLNSLVGSDSLTFYKQAKSLGLERKIKVFGDVGANLNSMKTIASAVPQSVWTPYYWYAQGDGNPVSQELYKIAVERTGTPFPYGFIGLAHDAVIALADAIKRAGSDNTADVIAALEAGRPLGAAGPVVFRKEDHTYTGEMTFINFGAAPGKPEGLEVNDVVRLSSLDYIEPATPGQPYILK
ncbi:ABC transporter substrate-binding protein [Xanthobacter autotrophicus DSM 431]|uniref:ABC transporter substrate-binding protein n=1 Tax=Xanthobacter nonsaccharivorans TaxID=3119912 RepID=UPI0037278E51